MSEVVDFAIQMKPTEERSNARYHLKRDNSMRLWRGETTAGAKVSVWCGPVLFDDQEKNKECDGILELVKPRYPRLRWATVGTFFSCIAIQAFIDWRCAVINAIAIAIGSAIVSIRQY